MLDIVLGIVLGVPAVLLLASMLLLLLKLVWNVILGRW
jgi:hypothetical protein